ncbi:hypothetical protein EDF60_2901 [Leucobacter luti]|uniref:YegP family protein n=1 Tax=Leucobacter luti TaxID=340320 RepID=UPI00104479F4|nr:DUF1508 domain-containing protein [Leucobacter luti]MCW2289076.1 uncharacterized protein YegP (UPF0339 family) [Leucobacter luti]TCK35523.1 hypothetical protein EDF60_2901 [Leucobacter luti]
MAAGFGISTDTAGEHRFRLGARNGEAFAVSEGHSSRTAAHNGIASVQQNASVAEIVELDCSLRARSRAIQSGHEHCQG